MKILATFHGRCDASNWKDAEELAENELLEYMDFTNIQRLSKKDAIFPFDFLAEWHNQKCLIDVTLRTKKPIKKKRLHTWRTLGFKTLLLMILPEHMITILIDIEDTHDWVNVSPSMIQQLEKELWDSLCQKQL